MNPFSALADLAVGFWKAGKAQAWAKLIFELLCSGVISFLVTCGGVLGTSAAAGKIAPAFCWLLGIGAGMVTAGICMTVVFRRSPLTKGLMLVLPSEEAAKEIAASLQVIERKP